MNRAIGEALGELEKVIAGKRAAIERVVLAMLAGGHVLLDDVPGVGKTTLAVALSRVFSLRFRRLQCTPDVLPSDIVGYSLPDRDTGEFVYRPGVVNGAELLLADEINRASSRTQSALLEAMEEKQVTVDGETHPLARPFLVVATENRVGAAGTQSLPFAQLDRFLLRLTIGYPDRAAQIALMRDRQQADPLESVRAVCSREDLLRMQEETRAVASTDRVLEYIARLAEASREENLLEVGVSPRGALFVDRAAKARAYIEGRDYTTGADVQAVFMDVCAHRVLPSRKARTEGVSPAKALEGLLARVENPDRRA